MNLGGPEIIIVAAVFVLLFGAKKLPELGASVGKSIKNFKRGIEDAHEDDDKRAEAEDDESVKSTS